MGKFYICVLLLEVKILAVYNCVPSCLPQLTMLLLLLLLSCFSRVRLCATP